MSEAFSLLDDIISVLPPFVRPITQKETEKAIRTIVATLEEFEARTRREEREIFLAEPRPIGIRDAAALQIAGHLAAVRIGVSRGHMLSDVAVVEIADASYRLADALGDRSNHGRTVAPPKAPATPPLPTPGPGKDIR